MTLMTEGEMLSLGKAPRKSLESLRCQITCEHKITARGLPYTEICCPPTPEGGVRVTQTSKMSLASL